MKSSILDCSIHWTEMQLDGNVTVQQSSSLPLITDVIQL